MTGEPVFNTPAHKRAVERTLKKLELDTPSDVFDEHISDLLADLMHLVYEADLDFDICLDQARKHYYREFLNPDDLAFSTD